MKTPVAFSLFASLILLIGQAFASPPEDTYSEERVTGRSRGNHDLDCTIIRPWGEAGPDAAPYPVIAWANGWDQGKVVGQTTTRGYKPGLIEWALDGPYIVVAANQWSVQESDVLACLQWVIDHETAADRNKLGLAGHSQGGGAVIKAGDGEPNGLEISAVVSMNPYGPAWVRSGNQDGPVMLLGGSDDTTTPVSSFLKVWKAIQDNDQGGLLAVLDGGTHNSEAWGVDADGNTLDSEGASQFNFGEFQEATELWWQLHLNGNIDAGVELKMLLDLPPWDTEYAFIEGGFDL
jgi:dienelactone hydrolase